MRNAARFVEPPRPKASHPIPWHPIYTEYIYHVYTPPTARANVPGQLFFGLGLGLALGFGLFLVFLANCVPLQGSREAASGEFF